MSSTFRANYYIWNGFDDELQKLAFGAPKPPPVPTAPGAGFQIPKPLKMVGKGLMKLLTPVAAGMSMLEVSKRVRSGGGRLPR